MLGQKVLADYPTLYFPKISELEKVMPSMREYIEKENIKNSTRDSKIETDSTLIVFNESSREFSLVFLQGRSVVSNSYYPNEGKHRSVFKILIIYQEFLRRSKQIDNMNGNLWIQC